VSSTCGKRISRICDPGNRGSVVTGSGRYEVARSLWIAFAPLLTGHPGYVVSQRIRKRIEEAFGWGKTVAGMRKLHHRGLPKVDWQFTLAMAAYDLVRLPKLFAQTAA
jgi:hypothetical protein